MNSSKKHTIHIVDFKIEGFLKMVSESLSKNGFQYGSCPKRFKKCLTYYSYKKSH